MVPKEVDTVDNLVSVLDSLPEKDNLSNNHKNKGE
jgi:hypothetical protein